MRWGGNFQLFLCPPPLKIGTTVAFFHESGKTPVLSEQLNRWVSCSGRASNASLHNLEDISPIPEDFSVSISLHRQITSSISVIFWPKIYPLRGVLFCQVRTYICEEGVHEIGDVVPFNFGA